MKFKVKVEGKTLYFKTEYTIDGTTWISGYKEKVSSGGEGVIVAPSSPPNFNTTKYRIIFTDSSWTNKESHWVYPPDSVKSGWPSSSGSMTEISGPFNWNNSSQYIYYVDAPNATGFKLTILC